MTPDSEKLYAVIKQLYKQKKANPRKQAPLSVDSLALYFGCNCDEILEIAEPLVMRGAIYIRTEPATHSVARKWHTNNGHIVLAEDAWA